MCIQLITQFEDTTGLEFIFAGPTITQCEYCGELKQYEQNHSCFKAEFENYFADVAINAWLSE